MSKILLVDDDHDQADSLALLFSASGHEVQTAYQGKDAAAASEVFLPHIVFLDLEMPGVNGFEACRAIRRSTCQEHPYIVALSGMEGSSVQRLTQEAGFNFYLPKPADVLTLLMIVDDFGQRERDANPGP